MIDLDGRQLKPDVRWMGCMLSSEAPFHYLITYWRGKHRRDPADYSARLLPKFGLIFARRGRRFLPRSEGRGDDGGRRFCVASAWIRHPACVEYEYRCTEYEYD